jgi:hypothetical protein
MYMCQDKGRTMRGEWGRQMWGGEDRDDRKRQKREEE